MFTDIVVGDDLSRPKNQKKKNSKNQKKSCQKEAAITNESMNKLSKSGKCEVISEMFGCKRVVGCASVKAISRMIVDAQLELLTMFDRGKVPHSSRENFWREVDRPKRSWRCFIDLIFLPGNPRGCCMELYYAFSLGV